MIMNLAKIFPVVIEAEILEMLIPWLKSHEGDIAEDVNDFGELAPVYEALFMEKAYSKNPAFRPPKN